MKITHVYSNMQTRVIDVISAEVTDDPNTIALDTAHDGQIIVCRHDEKALWQQLVQLGLVSI